MLSGPQPFSLRPLRPAGLSFRAGGLVSVQVLRPLGGGRWSVSVQGRVFPAAAEVQLAPGARLLARVSRSGGRLLLHVLGPAAEQASGPAGRTPDRVAAAFLAVGLKTRPEEIQKVRAPIWSG